AHRDPEPLPGHGDRRRCPREADAARRARDAGELRAGDAEVRRMIRRNLLPHREMRRERRQKDVVATIAITVIAGAALAFAGGFVINQQIEAQAARNAYVKAGIAKLDIEIAEIKTLEQEIASLQARQKAVEDL